METFILTVILAASAIPFLSSYIVDDKLTLFVSHNKSKMQLAGAMPTGYPSTASICCRENPGPVDIPLPAMPVMMWILSSMVSV